MCVIADSVAGSGAHNGVAGDMVSMVPSDQDYSGDYGYDLAHEVGVPRIPAQRTRSARSVRCVRFEVDPDGDLGYDEAHEG